MIYRLLADLVVVAHFSFIVFGLLGWLLVLWRRLFIFIHIPAALWVVLIEVAGWICPLTPLENRFRGLAGQAGYEGGFVAHYLIPIIYPEELTRDDQFLLAVIALVVNVVVYIFVGLRLRHR